MDCERFDKLSLELLYGELDDLSTAAARRHLNHCTRCQGVWNKLRATRELAVPLFEDPPGDLFESILLAEREAQRVLPLRERFGRAVSVLAGYAMRPQLAMAALLLLMVGSGVLFLRAAPGGQDRIGASELGAPSNEIVAEPKKAAAVALETDEQKAARFAATEATAAKSAERASGAPAGEPPAAVNASEKEGYQEAMQAYQEGRYAEAERLFSEVAAAGGEKAAAAALQEAHAARNGSGCQRATALYDQVSSRYSGSTVADEAAWQAATCYQALGQIARARAHYQALALRPAYRARAEQAMAALTPPAVAAIKAADLPAAEAEANAAAPATPAGEEAASGAAAKPAAAPAAKASAPAAAAPTSP